MAKEKKVEEVQLSPQNPGLVQPPESAQLQQPAPTDQPSALAQAVSTVSDTDLLEAVLAAPQEQLIPWEDVELPSRGQYYNWTTGVIRVRAWGAQIDKIMATARLAQTGQSIDMMLNHCCKFPDGFTPNLLLVGDQVFLLYYLRGITHGNIYEFAAKCPNQDCGQLGQYTADLNELAQTITWADPSIGTEPFRISLPYLSKQVGRDFTVGIRMMRVDDSQYIMRNRRAQTKVLGMGSKARVNAKTQPKQSAPRPEAVDLDDTLIQNLETIIVDAMGVTDRFKIRSLVNRMHSSDLAIIREWLREHSPGVDTQVTITCAECGTESKIALPITESFFRPQDAAAVRK